MARFNDCDCQGANFTNARIPYGNFARAVARGADFSGADLMQGNLHRLDDQDVIWSGANLKKCKKTDKDLAQAEDWKPPQPPEN